MANEIKYVSDISVIKTVDGTKKLFSLRDQKVKKDGALHTFGYESGVMYGGNLYVLVKKSTSFKPRIDALNKFVSDKKYYSMVGKNYNNDGRIVFSYQNTGFNLNNVGIVNEDGTIQEFHVTNNSYGSLNYTQQCMTPFLIGKYICYRKGEGSIGTSYIAIVDTETGIVVWENGSSFKYVCPCIYGTIIDEKAHFYVSVSNNLRSMVHIYENDNGTFSYSEKDDKRINIGGNSFSTSIIPFYKLPDGYYRCLIYEADNGNAYCIGDIADISRPNSSANRLVKNLESNCFPHYKYQCNIIGNNYLYSMYSNASKRLVIYDYNMNNVAYWSIPTIDSYSFIFIGDKLYTNTKTVGAKWIEQPLISV